MPDTFSPARTMCIIDKSSKGPILEPYYAEGSRTVSRSMSNFETSEDVRTVFGNGSLVNAFFEATKIGVDNLHLIRIEPSTDLEEYKQIKEAYEICDSLGVDIIIPATLNIDDQVFYYDDFKLTNEQFTLTEDTNRIELDYEPKNIESFKINEENVYNYSIEGNYVELPYNVSKNSYVSISYHVYSEMTINFRLIARDNNQILKKIEMERDFNPEEDEYITIDNAIDYFDIDIDDSVSFYVNHDIRFLEMYVSDDGYSRVYANINDEEYIESTIEKADVYDELASASKEIGAITIFNPPKEEDYIEFSNRIKDKDYTLLRHVISPVTEGSGIYTDNISVIIGCNMAIRSSEISLTNKDLNGLESFSNEHLELSSDDYIDAGYLYIDDTIRNGTVILKAQTFDTGTFRDLKTIRVSLDFARVIDRKVMYHIIGKPKSNYNILQKLYYETLDEFMNNNKIRNYEIDFDSTKLTNLSIVIDRSINLIEQSIISEDMTYA